MNHSTMLRIFRWVGWLEGASMLILLLIAMPLKYMYGIPQATRLVGSIHGFLFAIYVIQAWQIVSMLNWPKMMFVKAFVAAVFPFGTFIFDHKYLSHQNESLKSGRP